MHFFFRSCKYSACHSVCFSTRFRCMIQTHTKHTLCAIPNSKQFWLKTQQLHKNSQLHTKIYKCRCVFIAQNFVQIISNGNVKFCCLFLLLFTLICVHLPTSTLSMRVHRNSSSNKCGVNNSHCENCIGTIIWLLTFLIDRLVVVIVDALTMQFRRIAISLENSIRIAFANSIYMNLSAIGKKFNDFDNSNFFDEYRLFSIIGVIIQIWQQIKTKWMERERQKREDKKIQRKFPSICYGNNSMDFSLLIISNLRK